MAAVPLLSGQAVVRIFSSFGRSVARQRGSHIIMTKIVTHTYGDKI